jgi:hypothetical protein
MHNSLLRKVAHSKRIAESMGRQGDNDWVDRKNSGKAVDNSNEVCCCIYRRRHCSGRNQRLVGWYAVHLRKPVGWAKIRPRELHGYGGRGVMTETLAMTPSVRTSHVSKSEKVTCPKCDSSLKFYRSDKPHIDECGFESCAFKCSACGSVFVGIIDPIDDTLLVTTSS